MGRNVREMLDRGEINSEFLYIQLHLFITLFINHAFKMLLKCLNLGISNFIQLLFPIVDYFLHQSIAGANNKQSAF